MWLVQRFGGPGRELFAGRAGGSFSAFAAVPHIRVAAGLRVAEGPGVRLGGCFQRLGNVGGAVLGTLQGVHVQQGAHGFDAAAALAQDGGVQRIVEGKAVGLGLQLLLKLGDLLLGGGDSTSVECTLDVNGLGLFAKPAKLLEERLDMLRQTLGA